MFFYIIKRLVLAVPTLFGVSILVFLMLHLIPGDPALLILGEHASKASLAILREQMGLDKPLAVQYFIYISHIFHGNFGTSTVSGDSVLSEFMQRFPATVELSSVAMIFAIIMGIGAGIISALKRYSIFDYSAMTGSLAGVSMPVFWLGLMLIYVFSVKLAWLPVAGRLGYQFDITHITGLYLVDSLLTDNIPAFFDALKHLILPAFALSTIPMAIIARMTRASMLEVLKEEYIKTAKAKGCTKTQIILKHGLKNALLPILTVTGLMLGTLFGGAILTETTFSWPGIGKWLVNALNQRDFPVIQSATLIIASMFVIVNLVIDVLYAFVNPRIRLS